MPENLSINGYICETNNIYTELKTKNLSTDELASLDKNSDNKISEDEYVELSDSEEFEKNSEYDEDPHIAYYQKRYQREEKRIYELKCDILRYKNRQKEIKFQMENTTPNSDSDSESSNSAQELYEEINSKINATNSKINACIKIMSDATFAIQKRIDELNNRTSTSSTTVTNTNTDNSSVSNAGNISVESGSGKDLYNVTGDLSICLDRVAEGLGTTREGAADYIASVCNSAGGGKIDPKIILSQIFSESSGYYNVTTTETSDFVGLGQMSEVAVKAVNQEFGTNFTFEDMNDPAKNIEAMVYLMHYHYEKYDNNIGAAITAYATGHYDGTVIDYAKRVMSRVY